MASEQEARSLRRAGCLQPAQEINLREESTLWGTAASLSSWFIWLIIFDWASRALGKRDGCHHPAAAGPGAESSPSCTERAAVPGGKPSDGGSPQALSWPCWNVSHGQGVP